MVQGGLYNGLVRALQQFGLADAFGASEIPLLVLNVTYPLVPEEVSRFCAGKSAVLVLEEGTPEYIEKDLAQALRRLDVHTPVHGKDLLPAAGEYTVEVMAQGLLAFAERHLLDLGLAKVRDWLAGNAARRADVAGALGPLPARPPGFCTGCPESGRCSPRSSLRRRASGPCMWPPTSVAMRWPPSSLSARATPSWATA